MRMPVAEFHRLPRWKREDILQLVRAHGFDTVDTFDLEYSVMDAPMLTVWVYDRNDEGKCFLRTKAGGKGTIAQYKAGEAEIAHHTVDVLLRHPLPDWWRP